MGAAARSEHADLLPDIRHTVVLMMENHSYDSYLRAIPPSLTLPPLH